MLDLWKSVESRHRDIAEAESEEEYERALRGLERALDRLTRRIDERVREIERREPGGRNSRC